MAIRSGEYLKGKFEDGDRPKGADFSDLVDSTLNTSITSLSAAGVKTLSVGVGSVSAIGNLHTSGNTETLGNSNIGGTLTVTGNFESNNISNTDTTTTITNNVVVQGDHTITGTLSATNLTIPDNLVLGSDSTDTLTVNAKLVGDLIPKTDVTTSIGSTSNRFADGFFGGSIQSGIVSFDPLLTSNVTLPTTTRSFCIEELDINAGVTLNISSGAEIRITPYNSF
jgi:hypothetical protein